MFDREPQVVVLLTAALILLVVGSHRTQEPGQRLGFFLRTAKDAAILPTVIGLPIQLRTTTRLDAYTRSLDF